jgi:23S rRNA pseudouridine1911/1915/1917 synthase
LSNDNSVTASNRIPQPKVLFEDNHLLVIDKPAGLPTAGVKDRPSVYSWAGDYLKTRYNKPGNVYVGIVSRLDTVTSGVLVVARTSKAAARLSDQIQKHQVEKQYLAIAEGHLLVDSPIEWRDLVYKDDASHRMRVESENSPRNAKRGKETAQEAVLIIEQTQAVRAANCDATIATVRLQTGRKHQIRVQFASRRYALWGDHKYGSALPTLGVGIGLHAKTLSFSHPTRPETLVFEAPPPESWNIFSPA